MQKHVCIEIWWAIKWRIWKSVQRENRLSGSHLMVNLLVSYLEPVQVLSDIFVYGTEILSGIFQTDQIFRDIYEILSYMETRDSPKEIWFPQKEDETFACRGLWRNFCHLWTGEALHSRWEEANMWIHLHAEMCRTVSTKRSLDEGWLEATSSFVPGNTKLAEVWLIKLIAYTRKTATWWMRRMAQRRSLSCNQSFTLAGTKSQYPSFL